MKCYNCGNKVSTKNIECDYCGEDLRVLQKAYKLSNTYYNIGLSKAKVRDLTGAIFVLRKSLEINKRNTDARDLLGLIYFEMGEIVAAISEWVISKHIDSNSKRSESYLESIQSNPNKLDLYSQSIKKYNASLNLINQGNDDLAIIQLKKVLRLNPNYVKSLQLISLLHLHNQEYDKAYRYLIRAKKIDVSNTTTLKYLKEIETFGAEEVEEAKKQKMKKERQQEARPDPYVVSSYKEDKPNVGLFLSLIAGIVIGVIASIVLIVPTVRDESVNQFRDSEVEYNAEISKKEQELTSLRKDNEELLEEVSKLQANVAEAEEIAEEVSDTSDIDNLIQATALYIEGSANNDLDYVAVADSISKVDSSKLNNTSAINLYNTINDEVSMEASLSLYDEGHDLDTRGDYEGALEELLKSYEYNPTNIDAIYFIARSYHRLDNDEKAIEYYTILTDDYPATNRAREATSQLRQFE